MYMYYTGIKWLPDTLLFPVYGLNVFQSLAVMGALFVIYATRIGTT